MRHLLAVVCDCCGAQAQPGPTTEQARATASRWGFRPASVRVVGQLAASLGPQDRRPACIDHDGGHPT